MYEREKGGKGRGWGGSSKFSTRVNPVEVGGVRKRRKICIGRPFFYGLAGPEKKGRRQELCTVAEQQPSLLFLMGGGIRKEKEKVAATDA